MFGFPALDEGYPYNKRVPTQRRRQTEFSRSSSRRRLPPDRDAARITRPADRGFSVNTSVNGRRRDYGPVAGSLAAFDTLRMPAMSVVRSPLEIPKVGETAKPSGADRRFYHPLQQQAPASTRYGTAAVIVPPERWHIWRGVPFSAPGRAGAAALAMHSQFRDRFAFYKSLAVVPCVQRAVRREVMFALGYEGGHKTKRRRGPFSDLRC